MFSTRDAYNPFKPAVQYLVSGGRPTSYHHRKSSSGSLDSDTDRDMSSRSLHSSATAQIPLISLSRSPSPFPRKTSTSNPGSETEEDYLDDTPDRRPFLPEQDRVKGWRGLIQHGGLGQWLFNTPQGWQAYVGFLVLWLGACGIGLILMNRIILLTGVYKFPYPLTTTLFELLITHGLLICSASITRGLSGCLTSAGLAAAIAPSQPFQVSSPDPRAQRKKSGVVGKIARAFGGGSGGIAGGGLFEFDTRVARMVLPAAVIFVAKLVLSNLSFAYAQLPIYLLARIAIVPLSLVLTASINGTSHSVPLLSAALTATLNLLVASLRPNIRVTWESVVAGIFSSLFVALFPVQLQRSYKALVADLVPQGDLLASFNPMYNNGAADPSGTREECRATWRLLHYTSLLSILVLTPLVFLSGEVGNISRNCYFLDVFFHWLMILCGGIGSWAVFLGTVVLVKATSPLTTTFLFIPRSAFLLPVLNKFKLPAYSWVGIILCWLGCAWFLRVRRKESKTLDRVRLLY